MFTENGWCDIVIIWWQLTYCGTYQSGAKPNLVAKILATKLGVFFCYIYNSCFQKYVQYESNDNVIKYYGSEIPPDKDVSFEKFGGW